MACRLCEIEQEDLFERTGGSCGQIICCHEEENDGDADTISNDCITEEFPQTIEFKNNYDEDESPAIPFRNLPLKVVYKIKWIKNLSTVHGQRLILTLENEKKETVNVWDTSVLRRKLSGIVIDESKETRYIVSDGKGIVKGMKNPFYKFRTLVKKTVN